VGGDWWLEGKADLKKQKGSVLEASLADIQRPGRRLDGRGGGTVDE